ncbi:ALPHA/BETA-HYDROLASE [Salix purpurea]|uniref:ALPHA/BETA-HYDROLASE n=1 Tax=Salix purpurea TaxID=77065 RepID=A0A9Q0TXT5_SALPP|nr:ALPHA/BETA-HYDROLASE [Salix purpurea]
MLNHFDENWMKFLAICKQPVDRAEYNPKHDLLDQEFLLKGKWYQRKDVEVQNGRGDALQCSHYVPIVSPQEKPLPCVIYCHGNSGCRVDGSEAAIILLPSNITVFTLDFSGSGLSGGDHVTLGWNEKDDLMAVVNYLRQDGNVSLIGLWGRSMGAVTSLMYGAEDPSIAGMVLDSPFSDLVDLMMELVETYKFRLPKFTVKFAIQYMRKAIQKKAKFDIMNLNTIKVAKSCFVPVLFGHAIDDDFIRPHHSDRVFEAYMGDKNIIKFEGDHNSPRPQFYFDSINIFFHNVLQPPEDEVGGKYFETMQNYFGKESLSSLHEVGYNPESSVAVYKEPSSSSTAHAIEQVRSKKPMSRMEVPMDIQHEDHQSEAEHEEIGDHLPSSSKMISFELSNGHPYGPHVPTTMDENQYVEYQLEDLAGFPCDIEEEERMFMAAVIESLKDLEVRHPNAEGQPASVGPASVKSPQIDSGEASSIVEHDNPLNTPTSTSVRQHDPLKTESTSSSAVNDQNLATEGPSPATSASSVGTVFDTPSSIMRSESTTTSSRSDISGSVRSSTDTDMSGNTKATLTVERNPAGHIMDGLLRKWDFNLFRNGR